MAEHTHTHPHSHAHDHPHTHDHSHPPGDEGDTYFIDQLCMVGLSGAFGVICLCLYFWKTAMLKNMLGEQFHPYVLGSGIALTLLAFVRGAVLWFQSRDPNFQPGHDHDHGDEHGPEEHQHHVQEKSTQLQTAPTHQHVHGPSCGHEHAAGESCSHGQPTHEHDHHHHDHDAADHDHSWAPWRYVVILVPIILFLLDLPSTMPNIGDTGYERLLGDFLSIIYEAMPFIVLGVVIAGFLEEFVPQQAIAKMVPRNHFLAISIGALLGLVFPMCECGIIVVMKRLLRKGLPLSVCVAYMLAGPVINVVVMTSTYVAFSAYDKPNLNVLGGPWQVVAWRVGLSYLVAIVTGLVVEWQWHRHGLRLLHPSVARGLRKGVVENGNGKRTWGESANNITQTALHDFVDIMAFLVLGAVLAAGGKLIIKESNIQEFLQDTPAIAVLLMMGIAILFCLCSEADAFVAANFPLFWPDASKLAFLVLGPMLDFKLLLMYTRVYRARLIVTIVIALVVQVFTYSLIVGYFFGTDHPPEPKKVDMPPNVQTYLLGAGIGPDPLSQLVHFGVALRRSGQGGEIRYKELIDSAENPGQREFFKDKIYKVLGQYVPVGNDHVFKLARLRMLCCRNDTTEVFIPVFSRESIRKDYGAWVKVTARIEYHQQANGTIYPALMVAEAADVVTSFPDSDPYLK